MFILPISSEIRNVESLWRDTSHSIDEYQPDDGMMNLPPDGWRVLRRTLLFVYSFGGHRQSKFPMGKGLTYANPGLVEGGYPTMLGRCPQSSADGRNGIDASNALNESESEPLGLSVESGLAVVRFTKWVTRLVRKSGLLFTALY